MVHVLWGGVCLILCLGLYVWQRYSRSKLLHLAALTESKLKAIETKLVVEQSIKERLGVLSQELMTTLRANEKWYREARVTLTKGYEDEYEKLASNNDYLDAKLNSLLQRTDTDPTDKT